jgi:hypothetical protein
MTRCRPTPPDFGHLLQEDGSLLLQENNQGRLVVSYTQTFTPRFAFSTCEDTDLEFEHNREN